MANFDCCSLCANGKHSLLFPSVSTTARKNNSKSHREFFNGSLAHTIEIGRNRRRFCDSASFSLSLANANRVAKGKDYADRLDVPSLRVKIILF